MFDTSTTARPYLLHVHDGSAPVDRAMAERLAETGLCVETRGDVYGGLAYLGRRVAKKPAAVIVCVDGLSLRELPFFRIVSRRWPAIALYVYGSDRYDSLVTKAIEFGAAGRATDQVIESLSAAASTETSAKGGQTAAVMAPPDEPETDVAKVETATAKMAAATDESLDQADLADEANLANEKEGPDAVSRLPWVSYPDRPSRQPPQQDEAEPALAPSAAPSAAPAAAEDEDEDVDDDEADAPLLTEAELKALIGEDYVSPMSPSDPDHRKSPS